MEQSAKHLAVNGPAVGTVAGPSGTTLSDWSGYDWCDEVSLNQLSAFDRLVITTRNHTYEVIVTSPDTGDVMVRGGTIFPAVHGCPPGRQHARRRRDEGARRQRRLSGSICHRRVHADHHDSRAKARAGAALTAAARRRESPSGATKSVRRLPEL